jgi:hypothetical protein
MYWKVARELSSFSFRPAADKTARALKLFSPLIDRQQARPRDLRNLSAHCCALVNDELYLDSTCLAEKKGKQENSSHKHIASTSISLSRGYSKCEDNFLKLTYVT